MAPAALVSRGTASSAGEREKKAGVSDLNTLSGSQAAEDLRVKCTSSTEMGHFGVWGMRHLGSVESR